MAYVAAADFRTATQAEYCAGLTLSTADVSGASSEALLTAAIARLSKRIDDLTKDHFEQATATVYDLTGEGTTRLQLPQRCTAVTTVQTRDSLGNLTTQAATIYRLESSLDSAGATRLTHDAQDFLAIVRWQYLTGVEADPRFWPCGTKTVRVTGTFGWTVTPGDIKRALALMVFDHFKPLDGRLRRARTPQTDDRGFDYDTGPEAITGLTEADEILRDYMRQPGLLVG